MGKILITKKNINEYVDQNNRCLMLGRNMILTPGAKDEAREKNYTIKYVDAEKITMPSTDKEKEQPVAEVRLQAAAGALEGNSLQGSPQISLEQRIRKILREDYQIEEEKLVRMLADKINNQ